METSLAKIRGVFKYGSFDYNTRDWIKVHLLMIDYSFSFCNVTPLNNTLKQQGSIAKRKKSSWLLGNFNWTVGSVLCSPTLRKINFVFFESTIAALLFSRLRRLSWSFLQITWHEQKRQTSFDAANVKA
jgi:hypothetical protein